MSLFQTDSRNLFGEVKKQDALEDIQNWCSLHNVKTTAKRINYILNGISPDKITPTQVSDIGAHHVAEATEANRCVDVVVSNFSELKKRLDEPKTHILEAIRQIEGEDKPRGVFSFLRSSKQPRDIDTIRKEVKRNTEKAVALYRNLVQYHLDPFLDGIATANKTLDAIYEDIVNTMNTLDYIVDRSKDDMVKDLIYRRQEMFMKSQSLMVMNRGQMTNMEDICRQNKTFLEELELTVIPVVENVLRNALIKGDDSLDDISAALKRLL